jgi:hypothetical protein
LLRQRGDGFAGLLQLVRDGVPVIEFFQPAFASPKTSDALSDHAAPVSMAC